MHRLRIVAMLLVTGSLLAALAIGPAQAKKRSCKAKKEQSGCTLKAGTQYSGGKSPVFASVQVERNEWFVVANARRKCGRSAVGGDNYKGRPKVGQTYKFSSTRQQRIGTVRLNTTVTGSVKINSAKKATFSGTFAQSRDGATGTGSCGGPINFTADREQ